MRPAIFLLLALALSGPTLANIVTGSDSAGTAGLHLVAAILVARIAVTTVGRLFDNYRANVARRTEPQPSRPTQQ